MATAQDGQGGDGRFSESVILCVVCKVFCSSKISFGSAHDGAVHAASCSNFLYIGQFAVI